jgi:hypothetical protein
MSLESQLRAKTLEFIAGKVSFDDLAYWVQEHEADWAALKPESAARALTGTIMLSAYEVWNGHREVAAARELISEAAFNPTP